MVISAGFSGYLGVAVCSFGILAELTTFMGFNSIAGMSSIAYKAI